ncbi:hypothetical protein [Paenibacillus ginsengihumi]|uniref:hypothetical protein n=1 Tax=Paenibacillus ginsengihumi TaxID=431596 RepID=UPI0012EC509C|nr:hypothetical protein [Paenibacillus ginsengihumi]
MPLAHHHQMMKTGRPPWAIFKIDPHAAGASPSDDENGPPALGVIFKIDPHAAGASPSDDENGPRPKRYFQDRRKSCILYNKNGGITPVCDSMLYFVQHFWQYFRF